MLELKRNQTVLKSAISFETLAINPFLPVGNVCLGDRSDETEEKRLQFLDYIQKSVVSGKKERLEFKVDDNSKDRTNSLSQSFNISSLVVLKKNKLCDAYIHANVAYVGEQKSDFGLQGGNTVHKEILEFVLYYIRFHLQGGIWAPRAPRPPPPPPGGGGGGGWLWVCFC